MIRLATYDDVQAIAEGMMKLKAQTGWAQVENEGYNLRSLQQHIRASLMHSESVLYVLEREGRVIAFCGGILTRFTLPPYVPTICEWGWFGSKRDAARCWVAVRNWGRKHGAGFGLRITGTPGHSKRRVYEQLVWEVL